MLTGRVAVEELLPLLVAMESTPLADRRARGRRVADYALSFAPLALAIVFAILFCFFAHGTLVDQAPWVGVDVKATEVTERLKMARFAHENAKKKAADTSAAFEAAQREVSQAQAVAETAGRESDSSAKAEKLRAEINVSRKTAERSIAETAKVSALAALKQAETEMGDAKTAANKLPTSAASAEISVRLVWGAAAIGFSFLLVLVMLQSVREIHELSERAFDEQRKADWKSLLTFVGITGLAWLCLTWVKPFENHNFISGGKVATTLLQAIETNQLPAVSSDGVAAVPVGVAKVPAIQKLTRFMTMGCIVAVMLVALAVSTIFDQLRGKAQEIRQRDSAARLRNLNADVAWLRPIMEQTFALIQLTACALIAGVLEVYLLYLMAAHHVPVTLQADVHQFARAIGIVAGAVYSGLLIGIYLPIYDAQKTLNRLLHEAAPSAATPPANGGQGKTNAGADEPTADALPFPMLKSLATLLAPVLTAFVTMLAGFLNQTIGTAN